MMSARFRASSSKSGGQEFCPFQTSGWIYWKGKAADVAFAATALPPGFPGGVLSETAGVRALREDLIRRLNQLFKPGTCTDG
jgi:hypothetical protein